MKRTAWDSFPPSNNTEKDATILALWGALRIASEHLQQYRDYSEDMRKIGRGMYPSHEFSPEHAAAIIKDALDLAERAK